MICDVEWKHSFADLKFFKIGFTLKYPTFLRDRLFVVNLS